MSRFLDELTRACESSYWSQATKPILDYVVKGNEKSLAAARKNLAGSTWVFRFLTDIWQYTGAPEQLAIEEKRAMRGAVELGVDRYVADWLRPWLHRASADQDAALAAYLEAFGTGNPSRARAAATLMEWLGDSLEGTDGQPNAAGKFLLSFSNADLGAVAEQATALFDGLKFLCRHAGPRIVSVAGSFLYEGDAKYRFLSSRNCELLLAHDAKSLERIVADAAAREKDAGYQARAWEFLSERFPKKYQQTAKAANIAILSHDSDSIAFEHSVDSFRWLVSKFGVSILPDVEAQLSSYEWAPVVIRNLETLASELGAAASPGMIAALKHPEHEIRLAALSHLIGWPEPKDDQAVQECLEAGFAALYVQDVTKYIALSGRWQPARLEPALWKLFEHRSKPVRQAAARVLARTGDSAIANAIELLSAKKSAARSAAVTLLTIAESPAAAKALEARLDDETDEEVRDQILLALEHAWEVQGKKITRAQIDRRIERAKDKLQSPIAKWLNEKKLPALKFAAKSGGKLSPETVRYLFFRQSRAKEIRADVEAKPLFALIDRESSGDFALSLLEMFCGSAMAADDRWALTIAGLLGDDRIVSFLMQQIRKWVDTNRGKLAEYATQALALLGSDVALCAVDSLSIRYRSKQKNIGKAASEAFAEAAERLGLSVDELGDRVVPWLGFEPGQPRLLEEKDKRFEVRIGVDFKLEFRDLMKDKKISTLPGGISAAAKAEFKDLGATLREVLKGQLPRLENLMVRQYRWPVAKWQELYLVHPILFPFTTRLVWGLYGADGKLRTLFRALEDRTLTNEQDESVELPAGTGKGETIGIVHPLELSSDQRKSWMTHLADYNVESPFPQMERPVVSAAADEKDLKFSSKFAGTELNGLTFKGRAERLGWHRGSVIDGGGISGYCKSFPGAGADALLGVDGMYIGIDMYTSIKLERLCFVKTGSVKFASYVYDEPTDASDERLISFVQVPAIVFSETLGDMGKIAGTKAAEEGDEQ